MIVLETPVSAMNNCRTNFTCPFCNQRFCWFHVSPEKCEGCGKFLPDMDALKNNSEDRITYHWIASLERVKDDSVIYL